MPTRARMTPPNAPLRSTSRVTRPARYRAGRLGPLSHCVAGTSRGIMTVDMSRFGRDAGRRPAATTPITPRTRLQALQPLGAIARCRPDGGLIRTARIARGQRVAAPGSCCAARSALDAASDDSREIQRPGPRIALSISGGYGLRQSFWRVRNSSVAWLKSSASSCRPAWERCSKTTSSAPLMPSVSAGAKRVEVTRSQRP
jgi:hypothetical protein